MANVKVTIDRDQCISCESCWGLCPEVYEQNSVDSWSQIVAKYQVGGDPATGAVPRQSARQGPGSGRCLPGHDHPYRVIHDRPIHTMSLQIDVYTPRCAGLIISSVRTCHRRSRS